MAGFEFFWFASGSDNSEGAVDDQKEGDTAANGNCPFDEDRDKGLRFGRDTANGGISAGGWVRIWISWVDACTDPTGVKLVGFCNAGARVVRGMRRDDSKRSTNSRSRFTVESGKTFLFCLAT